jgi:putative oxidoreductase
MQSLEKLKPLALLLLRLGLAVIFIFHGFPKLFGHTQETLRFFVGMGFPPYFAYIAGVVEFFGGCVLAVGLFTRIAALLIAGEMAIAIWKVHLVHGVLAVSDYQFPLSLAVGAFALVALGAGVVSLDYAIFKTRA